MDDRKQEMMLAIAGTVPFVLDLKYGLIFVFRWCKKQSCMMRGV